jgi:histone-lysine N-methyltransferase SETMAR
MEGNIHYELLERNLTVTAERYCQQLLCLEEAIQQKRPGLRHGVILQHDKVRPHNENMTKVAIQELDWEILPHPPYSPDLAHRITTSSALSPTIVWSFLQQR